MRRWRSGQSHDTVNVAALCLRWFESNPAHQVGNCKVELAAAPCAAARAYCGLALNSNWRFRLVLWNKVPRNFVNWLTLTHAQRWHAAHHTIGHGHLYQGRYKSFLCEEDARFIQLVRHVERNPLRANLVQRAEQWRWGSAWRRTKGSPKQKNLLDEWPVSISRGYVTLLNEPQSEDEVDAMRRAVIRGNPYGSDTWTEKIIKKFKLETTVRPRGRPRKGS